MSYASGPVSCRALQPSDEVPLSSPCSGPHAPASDKLQAFLGCQEAAHDCAGERLAVPEQEAAEEAGAVSAAQPESKGLHGRFSGLRRGSKKRGTAAIAEKEQQDPAATAAGAHKQAGAAQAAAKPAK